MLPYLELQPRPRAAVEVERRPRGLGRRRYAMAGGLSCHTVNYFED
jgi:hypothetical protein